VSDANRVTFSGVGERCTDRANLEPCGIRDDGHDLPSPH
jgi:hypothetical protein